MFWSCRTCWCNVASYTKLRSNNSHFSKHIIPLSCSVVDVRGFSLIEVMVVMTILTLLAGVGLVMNMDDFRSYMFRDERNVLVAALQKARSQAVNNVCIGSSCTDGLPHGVHIAPGQYTIFQGASFVPGSSANLKIDGNANMSVICTTPEVIFGQLSGQVGTDWNVVLADAYGHTTTISVNKEGRIEY